jgi:hypothetical protein
MPGRGCGEVRDLSSSTAAANLIRLKSFFHSDLGSWRWRHAHIQNAAQHAVGRQLMTPNYARLCLPYVGAVCLRRSTVGLQDFTAEALTDPQTLALADRLLVVEDGNPAGIINKLPRLSSLSSFLGLIFDIRCISRRYDSAPSHGTAFLSFAVGIGGLDE